MRLAGLRVSNWMRFRGEYTLDLAPTVYAVVAEHVDDVERSNWLGKSALLAAVRFALFGTVPTETQDDAINRDADRVMVEVEMDTGLFVSRTRRRGKATELVATIPGIAGDVRDQETLERALGFDERTFLATCFFEQRSMARFVNARPADRTAIVNEWLDLQHLQDAHAVVLRQLAEHDARVINTRTRLDAARTARGRVDLAEVNAALGRLRTERLRWQGSFERARAFEAGARLRETLADIDERLAAMVEPPCPTEEARAEAAAELRDADDVVAVRTRAMREARALVDDGFDGQCPVTCSECPVADQVRRKRARHRTRLQEAEAEHEDALDVMQMAKEKHEAIEAMARKWRGYDATRRAVQGERDRVVEALRDTPDDCHDSAEACSTELQRIAATIRDHEMQIEAVNEADRVEQLLAGELATMDATRAALSLAATILGRGGVQRRVAESFLTYLERGATRRLQDAGIDLSVRLVWGRETQQLAESCDVCGAAFPRSAKVKACVCGAARGMKRDDKLHLELSDRSGAAEDMVGVALQLAAAEWLRSARGVEWSTAILDEPFGALDATHRAALARVLTGLAGDGFEQAFIVAHNRGVLDALPGRVLIEGDDASSRVRVL